MGWQVWKLTLKASDELELRLNLSQDGAITEATLTGIGGPEMLTTLTQWRPRLTGSLQALELPTGNSSPEILLREALLKAKGGWKAAYEEEELCHCRAIPTKVVHQAIVSGAHSPEIVSRWTSASTGCGTCRRDVVAMLEQMLAPQDQKRKSA